MFILTLLLLALGVFESTFATALVDPNGPYARPPNYRIDFLSFHVYTNASPEFVTWHYARVGLTSRIKERVFVLNMNFTLKKDLPMDAWLEVAAHEMKANHDFSLIPVRMFTGKFCDAVATDIYLYPDIVLQSNMPAKCPIKKGVYFYHDYRANERRLPYVLPGDRWRVDVTIKERQHGDPVLKYTMHFLVNRNI